MRKITWAPSALADLRDVYDYISLDSPDRAKRAVQDILKQTDKLSRFAKLGRTIPEIGESRYRELIVGEYRLMHEIRHGEILIFRVLHAKRLFSSQ